MKVAWLRLGRPDAITWFNVAFVVILQTSGSLLTSLVDFDGRLGEFVLVRLASLGVLASVLGLGHLVLRQVAGSAFAPVITLTTFFAALAAGTAAFDVLLVATEFTDTYTFTSRLIRALPGVMTGLVLVSLLVSSARELSRANVALATTAQELVALRSQAGDRITERHHTLTDRIRREIQGQLDLIGFGSASDAAVVRKLIDDVVRPLSYSIARAEPATHVMTAESHTNAVAWVRVLTDTLQRQPFHPFALSGVLGVIGSLFMIVTYGLPGALSVLALLVLVSLLTGLARLAWKALPQSVSVPIRLLAFLTVTALVSVTSALTITVVSGFSLIEPLQFTSWSTIVVIASFTVSMAFTVFDTLRDTNAALQQSVEDLKREVAALNTSLRQLHKSISRILHGPIQEAITSALIHVEGRSPGYVEDTFSTDLRRRIEEAMALLNAPSHTQGDPAKIVSNLKELWGATVDITLNASEEDLQTIRSHNATSYAVAEVVREACQNALRHGRATRLDVSIALDRRHRTVKVAVNNTGILPDPDAHPGLGSQLFDDLALSWSRSATQSGTHWEATLPLITE